MTPRSVNLEMVLIKPDAIEESTGALIMSEESRENAIKAQNKGMVEVVGEDVRWPKVGMYISFYRKAATDSSDGEDEFVIIHENHCLAEFSKK